MDALLITMMVLAPFGWFIYRMIRYTALDFAIDDYFKTVPIRRIPHKIPWVFPA